MTIAFIVLMCLTGLFAAFWLYSLLAEFWTSKLSSYEEWSDRFFNLAGRLLDKGDLPEEWVDTIASLNSWIDDRTMPMALSRVFDKKNRDARANGTSQNDLSPALSDFIDKHPDLSADYVSAMRAAMLAMTFLAPVNTGADIRAKMCEQWERLRSKSAGSAVKEFEAVKASHLKLVHSAA